MENWLPGEDYQYRQDWEEWLWDLETVCFELWQQILERTSGKERRRMFERFQENRKKNRSYSQQCRENFYRNEFQEPWMLQEKLRLLDREIEEGQKSASAEEGKVLERLALMEGLNAPKKEIRQYRERYRFLPSIREQMVQEYENAGAYEKAVWLLREAKNPNRRLWENGRTAAGNFWNSIGKPRGRRSIKRNFYTRFFSSAKETLSSFTASKRFAEARSGKSAGRSF